MDPNGRIYQDDPDKIPEADKARLDGYLRGRAEQDEMARLEEQVRELKTAMEARSGETGE